MLYRKLKRTWSHGYANYMPEFIKVFPELKNLDNEKVCDRFKKLRMEFYYEEKTKVNFWIRFTLPFAFILMILMLIGLPFNFIVTGNWGYCFTKKNRVYNWFKSLRLH